MGVCHVVQSPLNDDIYVHVYSKPFGGLEWMSSWPKDGLSLMDWRCSFTHRFVYRVLEVMDWRCSFTDIWESCFTDRFVYRVPVLEGTDLEQARDSFTGGKRENVDTMCRIECSTICSTICLCISPDLDGYRAPKK
jgi:hypothetical protein